MNLPWRRETRAVGAGWNRQHPAAVVFSQQPDEQAEGHPLLQAGRQTVADIAASLTIAPDAPLLGAVTSGWTDWPTMLAWASVRAVQGGRVVLRVRRDGGGVPVAVELPPVGAVRWQSDQGVERLLLEGRAAQAQDVIVLLDQTGQQATAYASLVAHAQRVADAHRAALRDLGGMLLLTPERTSPPADLPPGAEQAEQVRRNEWARAGVAVLPKGFQDVVHVKGDEQGLSLGPAQQALAEQAAAVYGVPASLLTGTAEPQHLRLAVAVLGERLSRLWAAALTPAMGLRPVVSPRAVAVTDPTMIEQLRVSQLVSVNEGRAALGLPPVDEAGADRVLEPVTGTAQPRRDDTAA